MMHYDVKKIKQLKLVSGEEIICEIIEETDEDLIVRAPLQIQFHTNEDTSRIWTFRLFMCYQDDPDRFVLVKVDKIMGIGNPIDQLIRQYLDGVQQMYVFDDEEDLTEAGHSEPYNPWEEWESKVTGSDSDGGKSNVLKFPTIH